MKITKYNGFKVQLDKYSNVGLVIFKTAIRRD